MAEGAQQERAKQAIRAWWRPARAARTQTGNRRASCPFDADQALPKWRLADRAAHRRQHHHYEDLLS